MWVRYGSDDGGSSAQVTTVTDYTGHLRALLSVREIINLKACSLLILTHGSLAELNPRRASITLARTALSHRDIGPIGLI